jgi:hypothetical protein
MLLSSVFDCDPSTLDKNTDTDVSAKTSVPAELCAVKRRCHIAPTIGLTTTIAQNPVDSRLGDHGAISRGLILDHLIADVQMVVSGLAFISAHGPPVADPIFA